MLSPVTTARDVVTSFWDAMRDNDWQRAAGHLAEDCPVDWPCSGERIRGRANFAAVQARYPTRTGRWTFDVRRLVADDGTAVSEVAVSDGEQSAVVVAFSEVDGGLITHQVEYWPNPYAPMPGRQDLTEPLSTADLWGGEREAGGAVLRDAHLGVRLPAQDLDRARAFYAERLGLEPAESRPGGLRYVCGDDSFVIFQSAGRPSGEHTQMGFYVPDIEAAVRELRDRGLVFDDVEMPGLSSRDGIVDIPGNYPSTGSVGERAVWFHDSEGNLLGLAQLVLPGSPDAERLAP
jgi:catechol 2,3-dioxygenase-like lactoylglutathione lyase family enzyme/limonene-1,2-epoxide hydrolase